MRSVDMQTWPDWNLSELYSRVGWGWDTHMQKCTQSASHSGLLHIGIIQDNSRGLSTQLQQHRLNIFTRSSSNNRTNMAASSKVDLAHSRVRDKRIGHSRSIRGLVVDDVHATSGKTSFPVDIAKSPEAFGRELRAFEDDSVSGCEGKDNGAGSEDIRGVPVVSSAGRSQVLTRGEM